MAGSGGRDKAVHMFFSVVLSYILTMLILLIIAFLMLKAGLGGTVVSVALVISWILPLFAGGFFMGRHVEHKRYLWGLTVGILYFIIYLLLSVIIKTEPSPVLSDYIKRGILILLSATFGGMLS